MLLLEGLMLSLMIKTQIKLLQSQPNVAKFILLDLGKQLLEEPSSVETNIEDKIKTWNKEKPKKLYKEYQNYDQFYRPHK